MGSAALTPIIKVNLEPEIQNVASEQLLLEIENLLLDVGGYLKPEKSKNEIQVTRYYDTRECNLFSHGIEARARKNRLDLKFDSAAKAVIRPDANGILWRVELKAKTDNKHSLAIFQNHEALQSFPSRLNKIFNKPIEQMFTSTFQKTKIYRDFAAPEGVGTVEYSLQRGHLESPDGKLRLPQKGEMVIIELEYRGGTSPTIKAEDVLEQAQAELETVFGPRGFNLMPERRVVMGYRLVEPTLKGKARDNVGQALEAYDKIASPMGAVA